MRRSAKMMTMKEMRFCIKVVVTGKGNLEQRGQSFRAQHTASAEAEAHLYVPANTYVKRV